MALESRKSAQQSDLASQPPAAPTSEPRHPISNLYLSIQDRSRQTIGKYTRTHPSKGFHSRSRSRSFLYPPSTTRYQTLIVAVVPLADILGERDLASDVRVTVAAGEKKAIARLRGLIQSRAIRAGSISLLGPTSWVPVAVPWLTRGRTRGREFKVGYSRAAAVLGSFCFS